MSIVKKLSMATAGAAFIALGAVTNPAIAQTVFEGRDNNVSFGSPLPNSNAAAAQFDNAASALGTVNVIDFENLPLGNFSSLEVAPGTTLTLSNTPDPVRSIVDLGITNDTENGFAGFNTTTEGANFLRFGTQPNVETIATATFSFAVPVQTFGAYITALDRDPRNELSLSFTDGTSQLLGPIRGVDSVNPSGAQFFGFTTPGESISSVTIRERFLDSPDNFNYLVGIDDVRTVPIPEPDSALGILAFGVGGSLLLLKRKLNGKGAAIRP